MRCGFVVSLLVRIFELSTSDDEIVPDNFVVVFLWPNILNPHGLKFTTDIINGNAKVI